MTEKNLRGKAVADLITEIIINKVKELREKSIIPKIAILRVGNREDDLAYERGVVNRFGKCGIEIKKVELDITCTQKDYIEALEDLNKDDSVHGILCFRPLPKHLNEKEIEKIIDPKKDIDCFSPVNMAKLFSGEKDGFTPCTPKAVMEILDYYNIDLEGKNVTVLGRSLVVGRPLSMLLLDKNATVTICHSKSKNLEDILKKSDIVVTCIGKAKFVDSKYISKDAVIIDVGINVDEENNLCGDVNYDDVLDIVSKITPVPGGVGSVTTSILANNLIKACTEINLF